MADAGASTTHHRWSICALLFFAATINYMDRQVIGLLKPVLQSQLGWTEIGYSNIVLAFQLAYAVGSADHGSSDGLAGHAQGILARGPDLERRCDGSRSRPIGSAVRDGSLRAGAG